MRYASGFRKGFLFTAGMLLAFCMVYAHAAADVVINEVMLSTATYISGEAYEWVELYNSGKQAVSLKGMTLTYTRKGETQTYTLDGKTKLKAGKYAVIFLTGGDEKATSGTTHYAPIDVSSKGGTFKLYDAEMNEVSSVTLGKQYCDVSYGLVYGTENTWQYLAEVTRGT